MKKFTVGLITKDCVIPRITTFTITDDTILAYKAESELFKIVVRKGKLRERLNGGGILYEEDCDIFTRKTGDYI